MSSNAVATPWGLYDALIRGIPEGVQVSHAIVNRWAAVTTESGSVGIAMAFDGGPHSDVNAWRLAGRSLREVASYAKSWNLRLASVGVAAMNAWYADAERLRAAPEVLFGPRTNFFASAGAHPLDRTAFVGHFPDVENLAGNVTVLERNPRGTDLPDSACEYVLPGCERVIITGSTLVNKTLPRLLELSANAEVHVVGPSTPPAVGIYPSCVHTIHGSVVVDPDECLHYVGLGLPKLARSTAVEMFSMALNPHRRAMGSHND